MRIYEFTSLPGTPEEALNSVMDMMAVYQGSGRDQVPINVVMRSLHRQGFDLDRRLLLDLIQDQPNIKRVTDDMIEIDTGEPDLMPVSDDEAEMSKEKVKQMAKKAIDIGEK